MSLRHSVTRRELIIGSGAAALFSAAEKLSVAAKPGGMYVGIRDEILMMGGYASIAEGMAENGIKGVEMAVDRNSTVRAINPTQDKPRLLLTDAKDRALLGKQAKDAGITISGLLFHNNFGAKDLDAEVAWVIGIVRAADNLHIPAVRIDSAMEGGRNLPVLERQQIFTRCVKQILAETRNVDLGIENHGVEGNDPEFLLGLIGMVGSKRLGITMDMGNFYWAGYPLEELYKTLERLAPHTRHTHVKNIAYPADMRNTRRQAGYEYSKYVCPIPEGDIDLKRVVGFLRKVNYRRDLCIEDESLGRYDQATRREHIKAAVAYLQQAIDA